MDIYEQSFDVLQYRLKSARRKKRLQKKDFDKQLIRMIKKQDQLYDTRWKLPMIPLSESYQSGWKRYFVLNDKLRRSDQASFYQTLLDKINTVRYASEKKFPAKKIRRNKKRNRKTKLLLERNQLLHEFSYSRWHDRSCKLTAQERQHFNCYECTNSKGTYSRLFYRFNEPWRFVFEVKPHFITHRKMLDAQLEQDIQLLNNRIKNQYLQPAMNKLTGGTYRHNGWYKGAKPHYRNPMRNLTLSRFLDQCENL